MTHLSRLVVAAIVCIAVIPLAAQPSPAIRERIQSFVAALNGSPEEHEAYAQKAFTAETLARSNAEKRKRNHARVRQDFGRLSVRDVERLSDTRLRINVEGATGARGTITLDIEAAPPHRITGSMFDIGKAKKGPALPPVPVSPSMTAPELSNALNDYIAKLVADGKFSGTVLVARDGKPVFERAYGLANRADQVPNTPGTRHNLGSINKHFTRTAIAQLAAAGKLTLDDTLGKHLPDHAQVDARKATVAQLLDHTAGLGDIFGPDFSKADKGSFRNNSDYYALVAPRPLTFPPGSSKRYCNACYVTLGEIVSRVSGMPYERYVEQNVLAPAGMRDTGFFMTDAVVPRLAIGYFETPEGVRSNVLTRGAAGSAAGSAFATASDLLALDNAMREGRLLDPKWTGWFLGDDTEARGRATASMTYAGGSGGINASVSGNGRWTVIAMANISPPAAEALSEEIFRALSAE